MHPDEFRAQAQRGADLVEAGDYAQAARVFEDLVAGDLSPFDKSMMCLNLATVHDRQQRRDEALAWLDRAIEHERRAGGFHAREQKAAYLAGIGRRADSRRLYETLLAQPGLAEPDRRRLQHNRDLLKNGSSSLPGEPVDVVVQGSGRWLVVVGAFELATVAALWVAALAGLLPAGPPAVVYSALGIWALIGLAALGAGLAQGRERYELTATRLRYTGLFRTRDIPTADIDDVTWETAFAVVPGAFGVLPLPSIVLRSRGRPLLRIGLLPGPSQRRDVARLIQGLARANPAVRLDRAVRELCGM